MKSRIGATAHRFNDRSYRTYWHKVGRKSFNISECSASVPLKKSGGTGRGTQK
jgi:hypothetical protein